MVRDRTPLIDEGSGLVNPATVRSRALRSIGGYSPLLRWYRHLRPEGLWAKTSPLGRTTMMFVAEHGLVVRHGPFAGLTYPRGIIAHAGYVPSKLLGCYEEELHPVLRSAVSWKPKTVVNVGSGDGYFAVGLARLLGEQSRVIGYEIDGRERRSARQLAAYNSVDVSFSGRCRPDDLNELPAGRWLLMVDVEGYERVLLDPSRVPELRGAWIIVELHETLGSQALTDLLRQRFSSSHESDLIVGRARSGSDYPELKDWQTQDAALAVTEGRTSFGTWMVLIPRECG